MSIFVDSRKLFRFILARSVLLTIRSGYIHRSDEDILSSCRGPKFEQIACATLRLKDTSSDVGTFDLTTLVANSTLPGECLVHCRVCSPFHVSVFLIHEILVSSTLMTSFFAVADGAAEVPLWGHYCVRVAAQPLCLTEDTVSGYLQLQVRTAGKVVPDPGRQSHESGKTIESLALCFRTTPQLNGNECIVCSRTCSFSATTLRLKVSLIPMSPFQSQRYLLSVYHLKCYGCKDGAFLYKSCLKCCADIRHLLNRKRKSTRRTLRRVRRRTHSC